MVEIFSLNEMRVYQCPNEAVSAQKGNREGLSVTNKGSRTLEA